MSTARKPQAVAALARIGQLLPAALAEHLAGAVVTNSLPTSPCKTALKAAHEALRTFPPEQRVAAALAAVSTGIEASLPFDRTTPDAGVVLAAGVYWLLNHQHQAEQLGEVLANLEAARSSGQRH